METKMEASEVKNPRNPFRVQKMKEEKKLRQKKRGRLIVRNISYKATEELMKEHFSQWGQLEEVKLLRRPTGELVGCGFVQYVNNFDANKALLIGNKTEFLGRKVYIDRALSKDVYLNKKQAIKSEDSAVEVKEEDDKDNVIDEKMEIKSEGEEEEFESDNDNDSKYNDEDEDSQSDEGDEESEEEDYMSESDEDESKPAITGLTAKGIKKVVNKSNDATDGCTVFVKNVPFDANDQDVRKCFRKFGLIKYAIVNREPISGHSKGTAFVRFKIRESADTLLQCKSQLILMNEVLECFPALSREHIQDQEKQKKLGTHKDSRNLYLAREGLIMAASKAAIGVSAADMQKRHQLEMIKNQVLKNLNR